MAAVGERVDSLSKQKKLKARKMPKKTRRVPPNPLHAVLGAILVAENEDYFEDCWSLKAANCERASPFTGIFFFRHHATNSSIFTLTFTT